jgi:hypothetical protein
MNKPASAFAVIAVSTSILAAHLWLQLREERALRLQARHVQTPTTGTPVQELPEVRIAPAARKAQPRDEHFIPAVPQ